MLCSTLRLPGARVLLRVSICTLVLSLTAGFIGCVLVPWLGGPSLFAADVPAICERLWNEYVRLEALNRRTQRLQELMTGKYDVVQEVIAGRLSLAEATARFRHLQGLMDDGQDELLGTYPTVEADDEAIARNVIMWVSEEMGKDPRRADVVARLERELVYARLVSGQSENRKWPQDKGR